MFRLTHTFGTYCIHMVVYFHQIPHTYVEGYKLQYKEYESTNHSTVVIKSWNASSYMITGLRASQYYEIQLNMFTTGGDGPWSRPIVVHTETGMAVHLNGNKSPLLVFFSQLYSVNAIRHRFATQQSPPWKCSKLCRVKILFEKEPEYLTAPQKL